MSFFEVCLEELTQTPNCSSSENNCWASTPIIRSESCEPRCSGSMGVKICILKSFDDSKNEYRKLNT